MLLQILKNEDPQKEYKENLLTFIRKNGGFHGSAEKVAKWIDYLTLEEIEDIFMNYLMF